ncbi:MAG: hypothetical protein ACJAZO_000353 [Myxococcota bacterium]
MVDNDHVDIHYYLEAPRLRPQDHDAPPQDVVPGISELQSGLILRVDGRAVPLTPVGDVDYRSSHTMAGVAVTLTALVPAGTTELTVENGNYPDLPGLFRTGWDFGPDWRLTDASLRSHQWVQGDDARTSTVSLVHRAPYERLLLSVSSQPIAAATTWRPGPLVAWRGNIPHPLGAALVLLLTPLAGWTARLPRGPSLGVSLAAGVGLGACAAAFATVNVAAVPVSLCLLALVSLWTPARWLGGWVALFALACACPLWPWSIAIGIVGAALARREQPSSIDAVGVGLAVLVGGMWALRLL